MPRPAIGAAPMTTAQRVQRHRQNQATEIVELRRALLDALTVFDIGEATDFRRTYAGLIARAEAAQPK